MRKSRCIIIVAIAASLTLALCGCDETQKPPATEEGEFPFRFVYELNGETYDIEDAVVCKFRGYDYSAWFTKPRRWDAYLKSGTGRISILSEENVYSVLNPRRLNIEIEVFLDYGRAEYYMEDPNARSFVHCKPQISYRETYRESERATISDITALSNKQLEKYFGIKVIEFTFSKPINNTFK